MEYQLSEQSYLAFSAFLQKKVGILLGTNRQYLVRSRLSTIARNKKYTDLNKFLSYVMSCQDIALTENCLELMTTNETFWFRDEYPYFILLNEILPILYKRQKSLRIWSSACSSGQEPYSIAMTIAKFQIQYPNAFYGGIEILGTDYSSKMITAAVSGTYDDLAMNRGLPNEHKQTFFTAVKNNKMQITPYIKNMVKFERFNLMQDFSRFGKFDIVFCRNVLIYFDGKQKNQILNKLAACLPQNGTLFLGAAESIMGSESLFQMESRSTGLYYSKV